MPHRDRQLLTLMTYLSSRKIQFTVLAITTMVALTVFLYGANGIRGTDQYWYLGDVETLISKQDPLTNIVYPAKLLREHGASSTPNYFMHNGPLLHLVAHLSRDSDPYHIWILLNLISHIAVAAVIFAICKSYTTAHIAVWLTSLYLLSPIAIWQSINMLQEQLYAGLFALSILWLAFPKIKWLQVIATIFTLAGICSHPIFFIVGIFNAVAWCIQGILDRRHYKTIVGISLGVLYVVTKSSSDQYFPSSFQPDLSAIISGSVPGKSNMLWHYSDTQAEINIALLWNKFKFAVENHLLTLRNLPFYIYTNIALLLLPITILTGVRKYPWILLFTLCIGLGSYLAILVLMQIQPRYQQIVAVVTFVSIGFGIKELSGKISSRKFKVLFNIGTMLLVVATTSVSMYLAHTAHKQSEAEAISMNSLANNIEELPLDARILILDSTKHELKLSYALKPRKVLAARTDFIDTSALLKATSIFDPTHVISIKNIQWDGVSTKNVKKIEDEYLGNIFIGGVNTDY